MAEGCYNPDDHYLPASFKGIPFEALEVTSEHGRRGAKGEFVWGEETGYVDLGRRIRSYSISGRFIDNNHVLMAEALRRVVETPGPGILIHPTRGILRVACETLRIIDNPIEDAGITRFEGEFVEANELGTGLQFGLDTINLVIIGILTAAGDSFRQRYSPNSSRIYYHNQIVNTMAEGVAAIGGAYERATVSSADDTRWQLLANFRAVANDRNIVSDAEQAITVVQNGLSFINRDASSAEAKIFAYRSIANWAAQSSALPGEAGMMENAVYSLVRISAAACLTQSILDTEPENISTALTQFDAVRHIFEQEMTAANADCNDPKLYLELASFAKEARYALLNRAYNANALIQYTLPGATHSLVAAWEIYGDSKRFTDIERYNNGLPWSVGPDIIATRS